MTIFHLSDSPLEDVDPLDSRLAELQGGPPARRPRRWLRHRLALGLSPSPTPGLILIPVGLALGPVGLNLLSQPVLEYLDPVVSVTIAALGVFVGLGLNLKRPKEGLLLAAASLEAGLTIVLVALGVLAADALWARTGWASGLAVLTLGLCASASATAPQSADEPPSLPTRIGDLDDILPILAGGLALAFLREASPAASIGLTIAFALVAAIIAAAAWLLVGSTTPESEQHVFVAGALLLLGGAAAYLSQSALFAGLIAGLCWNAAGGPAKERIERDMRYLQHPLIVLLLLVAGARLTWSVVIVALAVVYLTCRLAGKLAGGWVVGQMIERHWRRDLGISFVPPGVTGIAFALNAQHADPTADRGVALLAIVVIGSLASELLAMFVRARDLPG